MGCELRKVCDGEGCRIGRRKKLDHDAVSVETSSNPIGSWDDPSELSQLGTSGGVWYFHRDQS